MALRIRDHLAYEVLDGEAVILDLDAARYYSLNRTATCVWQAIAAGDDLRSAARALASRFEVGDDRAVADAQSLAGELEALGLLVSSE